MARNLSEVHCWRVLHLLTLDARQQSRYTEEDLAWFRRPLR